MSEKKGPPVATENMVEERANRVENEPTTSTVTIHFTVQKRLRISIHYVNWVFIRGKISKFNRYHLCLSCNHGQFFFFIYLFIFFFFGTSSQLSEFQDTKANQALPLGPCGWQHGTFVLPECASVQHCLCMHVHASGASPCEENKIQQRKKRDIPPPPPPSYYPKPQCRISALSLPPGSEKQDRRRAN